MARIARIKFPHQRTWYHICCRVVARDGEFPLADPTAARALIATIRRYASVYFCRIAAFCVMGNHYHLVIRFDPERPVDRDELYSRARAMYPGEAHRRWIETWSHEQWERYRKRLFDLSEFMRNVQGSFATWYNRAHSRRGPFWAGRFKSVVLADDRALVDCVLYVELNAVRAGLVQRPEEWRFGSVFLREIGRDGWLLPVESLLSHTDHREALVEFRQLLYHRGAVPSRAGQARIPEEVLEREAARGFSIRGAFRRRLGYFVDGLLLGARDVVADHLARLRAEGRYHRRGEPVQQLGGICWSLKAPRDAPPAW